MADRLTLRQDVYVYLEDFQQTTEPEEINRLLDRAQVEFQNETKIVRTSKVVRVDGGTASADYIPGLANLSARGSVIAVDVTTAGSGYDDTLTLTFATISGGTRATGLPVVVSGAVVAVTINNPGEGYTSAPAITFASGAAAATAIIDGPAGTSLVGGEILRVEDVSTNATKLNPTTEEKMDILFGANWRATTYNPASASPSRWLRGKEGENTIRIYPSPTADTQVRVYFPTSIAALSDDDAQPQIPTPYHDALPWWVAHRLLMLKGETEKAVAAKARYDSFIETARRAVASF